MGFWDAFKKKEDTRTTEEKVAELEKQAKVDRAEETLRRNREKLDAEKRAEEELKRQEREMESKPVKKPTKKKAVTKAKTKRKITRKTTQKTTRKKTKAIKGTGVYTAAGTYTAAGKTQTAMNKAIKRADRVSGVALSSPRSIRLTPRTPKLR